MSERKYTIETTIAGYARNALRELADRSRWGAAEWHSAREIGSALDQDHGDRWPNYALEILHANGWIDLKGDPDLPGSLLGRINGMGVLAFEQGAIPSVDALGSAVRMGHSSEVAVYVVAVDGALKTDILEKLQALRRAIRGDNAHDLNEADRELIAREVESLQTDIQSGRVWRSKLQDSLSARGILKWLANRFAETIVGKLADAACSAVARLLGIDS